MWSCETLMSLVWMALGTEASRETVQMPEMNHTLLLPLGTMARSGCRMDMYLSG